MTLSAIEKSDGESLLRRCMWSVSVVAWVKRCTWFMIMGFRSSLCMLFRLSMSIWYVCLPSHFCGHALSIWKHRSCHITCLYSIVCISCVLKPNLTASFCQLGIRAANCTRNPLTSLLSTSSGWSNPTCGLPFWLLVLLDPLHFFHLVLMVVASSSLRLSYHGWAILNSLVWASLWCSFHFRRSSSTRLTFLH